MPHPKGQGPGANGPAAPSYPVDLCILGTPFRVLTITHTIQHCYYKKYKKQV